MSNSKSQAKVRAAKVRFQILENLEKAPLYKKSTGDDSFFFILYNPSATENSTINVENCPYLSNLEFDDEEYFLYLF